MNDKILRSPFFYVGDKHKLINEIRKFFPQKIDTFVEPFVGGGSVFMNVQANSYCLNDIEGESGYFNCGGNNQELLLHHCPVGINDWSHVSVGNETQYEAVMSRIQGLSICTQNQLQ